MLEILNKNQIFLNAQRQRFGPINCRLLDQSRTDKSMPMIGKGEKNIDEWVSASNNYLIYDQMFPSEMGIINFKNQLQEAGQKKGSNIFQYRHNQTTDAHLMWSLSEIRDIQVQIGANPDDQSTELNYRPSLLLSLGTGDGKLLKELMHKFKPFHVCIGLRSFDDLESSFMEIDWCELWNQRCEDRLNKISFIPYQEVSQLRSALLANSLISLEHSFVVVPGENVNSKYLEDKKNLGGHELQIGIDYLGFVTDEYNMLWNSVDSLSCLPRMFKVPAQKIGGNYVVCGSGPSLDKSIEYLKKLPESWSIIACASNYRTLRAAGIDVDILCLLERGENEYHQYLSVKNEFGLGDTRLFASVTCDHRLQNLFKDTMVYFRPALTPTALFSSSQLQVLPFEGPQTVNTGVALCAALGATNVVLVGVDLGTSSLSKVRSDQAVGISPRDFKLTEKGNFTSKVYTSVQLRDARLVIEACLANNIKMNVINASNGIFIKGAQPMQIDSINFDLLSEQEKENSSYPISLDAWWTQTNYFELKGLLSSWNAARPRAATTALLDQIRDLLDSPEPWFPVVQDKLSQILALKGGAYNQIGPRLFRGLFLKLGIVISRQSYVLLKQDPTGSLQSSFMRQTRAALIRLCTELEEEVFELYDELEKSLSIS